MATTASKNLVICLDGTSNEIRARGNTNVVRILQALSENYVADHSPDCLFPDSDHRDTAPCPRFRPQQLLYYDPGVGTFSSPSVWTPFGRWMSRMAGQAFGLGMKTNLTEAYTFLMNNWNPGDRIYIFGFSRGAFTARALAGLLHVIGIPRRSSENLVQYAITAYARRTEKWSPDDYDSAENFRRTVCRVVVGDSAERVDPLAGATGASKFSVPVEYLGLWDTVSAPGIFRREMLFPCADSLENVLSGRHAVALDERRRPFAPRTVVPRPGARLPFPRNPGIEESWFSGIHSDIGGSKPRNTGLGDITLMWVLAGAVERNIVLRQRAEDRGLPVLNRAMASQPCNANGRIWKLAGSRTRRPQVGVDRLHASVRDRFSAAGNQSVGLDVEFDGDVQWYDTRFPAVAPAGYTAMRSAATSSR
ncbi:T6SS phospholipase effector Tle1-like catalytic domain-containing protein [Actinomycetes bacterium M1A6_2h]